MSNTDIKHITLMPYSKVLLKWVMLMRKFNYEFFLEWTATFILLTGAACTSLNIYPLNVYLSMAGNFGWFLVALMWRKWSLISIQVIITFIYIWGLFNTGVFKI